MRRARVDKAATTLNRFPYKYEAIDHAYDRFLEQGTLPEDDHLAWRVLKRVLRARRKVPEIEAERLALGLHQPYGTTREMLFREAVCKVKEVRKLARWLLRIAAEAGHDLTDPELIGPEMEDWDMQPICMRLLGWPEDFVRPEYQKQLERLIRQQAEDRRTRPPKTDEWTTGAAQALCDFMSRGVVPTDTRFFGFAMGVAEVFALANHYRGHGGEELLAAFEAIATGTAEERADALRRIGALQLQANELRANRGDD